MKRVSQKSAGFSSSEKGCASYVYHDGELASDQFTHSGMKTSRQFADTSQRERERECNRWFEILDSWDFLIFNFWLNDSFIFSFSFVLCPVQ